MDGGVDGSGGEGLDEYDMVVIRPRKNSLPNWLNKMNPEERKRLFETIGYVQNSSFETDPSVRCFSGVRMFAKFAFLFLVRGTKIQPESRDFHALLGEFWKRSFEDVSFTIAHDF